ncbi:MAG: ABC transporter permease [Acidobacteria bacterium]|nr:ABC transporter permease [Acidobacteriota bacterium]
MREWINRLVDVFRRGRLDRELAEELRFHEGHLERGAADAGLSPDAASAQARRRLGNVTQITEATRERWSFQWLDHLQQDVRFAWRGLRRTPSFTVSVVLTLALGIGANTVMFGVVDRLMFKPLDYLHDPGTVHRLYLQTLERGIVGTSVWVQYERYRDFETRTTSFSHIACLNERLMAVGRGDALREIRVAGVTASYFDFFDMAPAAGRFFGPSEDIAPSGTPVAVLAHAYWVAEYGRRDVVGESMALGNLSVTIIGVAPPGFTGLDDAQPSQIFLPLTALGPAMGGPATAGFSQGYRFLWGNVIVRRKAGVSVEQATADATEGYRLSWQRQRDQAPPGTPPLRSLEDAQPRVLVSALRTGNGPAPSLDARTSLWTSGVAALLLIITVANVANLLLGRTLERRQETAVRLALGVSRRRLIAHLLTESVVLACLGAAGAVLVTYGLGSAVLGLLTTTTGPTAALLDSRTLLVTVALAILVAMTTGLVPAWIASRVTVAPALRRGPREAGGGGRLRMMLVVTQAALSLVLIVGALLFVRSLAAVRAMPLGYEPGRIVMVNQVLRGAPLPPEALVALRRSLLDAARVHPAVEAAAWRSSTPLGTTMQIRFVADGAPPVETLGMFSGQEGTPDYFSVMGTRILRGRSFTDDDRVGSPLVAVVSESTARVLWPGQEAIGKCMRFGREPAECTSVIGIAEDIVANSLTETQRYQLYFPIEQTAPAGGSGMFLRVRGDAAAQAAVLRQALQPLMPGTSYLTVQPMSSLLVRPQRSWRLGATMFGAFGMLALVVAAIGLYGVISYSVAQRRREMGVRIALGANRRDIVWLVTRQGLAVATAGVLLGVGLALVFSGQVQPLLFSQSAKDPGVYAIAGGVLVLVAVIATLLPATRASRANPTEALRGE